MAPCEKIFGRDREDRSNSKESFCDECSGTEEEMLGLAIESSRDPERATAVIEALKAITSGAKILSKDN